MSHFTNVTLQDLRDMGGRLPSNLVFRCPDHPVCDPIDPKEYDLVMYDLQFVLLDKMNHTAYWFDKDGVSIHSELRLARKMPNRYAVIGATPYMAMDSGGVTKVNVYPAWDGHGDGHQLYTDLDKARKFATKLRMANRNGHIIILNLNTDSLESLT